MDISEYVSMLDGQFRVHWSDSYLSGIWSDVSTATTKRWSKHLAALYDLTACAGAQDFPSALFCFLLLFWFVVSTRKLTIRFLVLCVSHMTSLGKFRRQFTHHKDNAIKRALEELQRLCRGEPGLLVSKHSFLSELCHSLNYSIVLTQWRRRERSVL